MHLYLQRWGLSLQKPLARAKERSPAAVKAWLETDYPAIARRAKAQKATLDFTSLGARNALVMVVR